MATSVVRQLAVRPRASALQGALTGAVRPPSQRPLAAVLASAASSPRLRWSSSASSPSASPESPFPFPPERPVYKNKKVWPPDFSQLSPQEQLRFEKRYKRRVALKSARPQWNKFVKLAQLFTITFVVIYCVLFMEWQQGPNPFEGFRKWFWDSLGLMEKGPYAATTLPKQDGSKEAEQKTTK